MSKDITAFRDLLLERGFITSADATLTPLTGGVSSEIVLVEEGDTRFVIKRALEKLKVAADWFADTSRNHSEQAYIRYVGEFRPDAMPEILRSDAEAGLFSMEFLDGFSNWKSDMLQGHCDVDLARKAGGLLGEIHARSWGDATAREAFDNIPNFDQLRIDPYLRATAANHLELADLILAEAERLTQSQECLIHGDYSPKNMLHKDGRLVALDCEVACFADAAFDVSFFLNHLFLKSLYHARRPDSPDDLPFAAMISKARAAYEQANTTHAADVTQRVAHLLPMLMLARVDGKSPVEYFDAPRHDFVRRFVTHTLKHQQVDPSSTTLDSIADDWFAALETFQP